jgi:hypothetical protein
LNTDGATCSQLEQRFNENLVDDNYYEKIVSVRAARIFVYAIATFVLVTSATLMVTLKTSTSLHSATDQGVTEGPSFFFPSTGFGGYSKTGKVREIGASWKVPEILSSSKPGVASTWIGAQTSVNNDFIQIGVNEFAFKSGAPAYQLFWSDTAEKFHPHNLGDVHAGELINVSMTKNATGWRLRVRNQSKSLSVSKQVNYAASVSFTMAEWIQENPAPAMVSARDTPYPNIDNVTFQKLKVNGRSPRLQRSDGQVLIASSGAIRVPTLVLHDSFTFLAPKGAARQYLIDARRLDAGVSIFDAAEVRWSTTSTKERRQDVLALIDILKKNVGVFESQTWPKATRAPLSKLDTLTTSEISEFQAWSRTTMSLDAPDYTKFMAALPEHDDLVDQIRASLDLPPLE